MSKLILVAIIFVILVAVLLGVYFIFINSNNSNMPEVTNQPPMTNNNTTTIQGMKVESLKAGEGAQVKNGDYITVNYVGTLTDGSKFDSSIDRNAPFSFTVGEGKVIKGWDLGVVGMKVGEKRKFTVPPELGYGAGGFPPIIPQNATLIFEVELLKID